MITNKDIATLLEKFMAGNTTIEEEDRLAQFFRGNDVPEEWADYKKMFAYFDAGMPERSEERRVKNEESKGSEERRVKNEELKVNEERRTKNEERVEKNSSLFTLHSSLPVLHSSFFIKRILPITSIAAAAALFFILTTKKGSDTLQPQIPQTTEVRQMATITDTTHNVEMDTAKVIVTPHKKTKHRITHRQYRMEIPRPLMAETAVTDSVTFLEQELLRCENEKAKADEELQRCLEQYSDERIEINGMAFFLDNQDENAYEEDENEGEETNKSNVVVY